MGGSPAALARCIPALEAMATTVEHLGEIGAASALKLAVNALLGVGMAAMAEVLELGAATGLSRRRLLDEVVASPVVAPAIRGRRPWIEGGTEETHFPLEWMRKDLLLAIEAVSDEGRELGLLRAAVGRYAEAAEAGRKRRDFATVAAPNRGSPDD